MHNYRLTLGYFCALVCWFVFLVCILYTYICNAYHFVCLCVCVCVCVSGRIWGEGGVILPLTSQLAYPQIHSQTAAQSLLRFYNNSSSSDDLSVNSPRTSEVNSPPGVSLL